MRGLDGLAAGWRVQLHTLRAERDYWLTFAVNPFFAVLPWPRALWIAPLLLLVAVSTYLMASCFGALVLRAMDLRNLVSNISLFTILTICGVNVPTSFFPAPIRLLADVLPLTHGLQAIRGVLGAAAPLLILQEAALEAVVGIAWLSLALVAFYSLVGTGRKDGSIEFG